MSQFSFQSQFMSIMELLTEAALTEIHRRVDDRCAFMRVELSRSRKDIDALKRKCVMMESELRRVKGRGKRRVWISGTSDRCPTALRTDCVRNADVITSQEQETPDHIHNIHQVLDDEIRSPEIKQERGEEEAGSGERENVPSDHEQHIQPQEKMERLNAFLEDPQFKHTQTCPELCERVKPDEERLGLQVKVEINIEEEERNITGDHQHRLWPSAPEATRDIQRENTDRTSVTPHHSQNTSIFSWPDDTEPPRYKLHHAERTQTEPSQCGQISADVQNRLSWCGEDAHEPGHVTHSDERNSNDAAYNMLHESNAATDVCPAHAGRETFGVTRRFRTHWRSSVDAVKRFSCSFCSKGFKRFSQLKEHLRSHTGEKPFTCDQCGRSFTKHCNLTRHAVVHSGEKPFQCVQCGKCFTQRSSLKSHQKMHSNEWNIEMR